MKAHLLYVEDDASLSFVTRDHLELAKHNLNEHFAVAGIAERFDDSLQSLQRFFGWSHPTQVPPRNVTQARPASHTLPKGVIARIRELNALDAELHRYVEERMGQKQR